jgi:hypothetical protein
MPRIHTITTDTVLSDNDMLLGTDGAVGANKATKNFSFGVFKNYITSNVTFTGDTIISGGSLTLDNNEFLMSKMANGTAASLIGISSNNQIKLSNSNLPIYTGTGLVSLGGNLELPNGNIIASGTLGASGYNDSNWNTAYSWGNHATAGYLPLTGGIITGNMTNRGEQSFGVDGDGENFKIYTNTSGKLLSFNPAANGKLNLTDNTMATFGNSDDLQIYHNGTANYIDSNGGQMFLRASVSDGKMYFMGDDGNGGHTEYFYLDGAAAVYNSNSGQAASVETRFPPDSKATFGITGAMQTSLWNSDAGNFFMSETGGGDMYFHSDGAKIVIGKRGSGATHSNPLIDAENMIVANTDGSVELYHDNSKKLETTASGIKTTGTININGAYSLPITDGTNGQVLKTNGSGVVAFANDLGNIPFINGGTDFTNSLIIGHSTHVGTLDAAQRNIGIGKSVLEDLTTGDDNTVMGYNAGKSITGGAQNVLIGREAGKFVTTANDIIAIGVGAGDSHNDGGAGDIAIGTEALTMGHSSSGVKGRVAIGFNAGTRNQSSYNTFVGWKAGATQAGLDSSGVFHDEVLHSNSNSRCIVLGANAGTSTSGTLDNEIVIGFGAKGKGANTVVIGNNATTAWLPHDDNGVDLGSGSLSFKDAYIQSSLKIGDTSGSTYFQLPSTIGTSGQVLKVPASGNALVWAADMPQFIQEGGEFTNSLIIGHITTGTLDQALGNTGIGVGAMNAITTGDSNVAVGHDAAGGLTTGGFNVAIGKQALFSATTNNQNVAIGKDALYAANYDSAATDGNQNTAIGFSCGSGVTTGTGNVFIGFDTAKSITTGNDNIVIGSESNINTVKSGTIVIGHGIVDNYVENNSTYIGHTNTTKANIVGLRKNLSYTSSASQQVLLSQSGGIHRMNSATPSVTTLPNIAVSAAVGFEIEFVIGTLPSGGVHKIVCHSTSSQEFVGSVNALDGTTLKGYSAQDSDNYSAISINGTTTGVVGTRIKLTCITSGKWLISGTIITNGTPVNPFTTT